MQRIVLTAALAFLLTRAAGESARAREVPGPQPDGSMLLHSQWSIRPAGSQIPLGEFPVNLAVDPSGRYAAALHAGHGQHQVWIIDLDRGQVTSRAPLKEAFEGIAFSPDGLSLVVSGGGNGLVRVFAFNRGQLAPRPDIRVGSGPGRSVVAGVAVAPDNKTVFAALVFSGKIVRASMETGRIDWTAILDPQADAEAFASQAATAGQEPNDLPLSEKLSECPDPLSVAVDWPRRRVYASLWGKSGVAVLDADSGARVAQWPAGLHPNELLLSRDGTRLFVSNGGLNTVTELDTRDGRPVETLVSAFAAGDPPGSTPDSLSLSPDGRTLFVANASINTVAVFDVATPGASRPLGFIPTGWLPTRVRATPDGRRLLVVSARGLSAKANLPPAPEVAAASPRSLFKSVSPGPGLPKTLYPYIGTLYNGSLGVVSLPDKDDLESKMRQWTRTSQLCRPVEAQPPGPGNPIPPRRGTLGKRTASPIRYVIYIVKENRTYDGVFGDMPEGNGAPSLCLFPEAVTPNLHRIARQFVLLDNFFANAEVSASGHEWSMAGYCSEFVEKLWPPNYGHKRGGIPYPAEGRHAAAIPASGYLWDRAREAGVSYRVYGEFSGGKATAAEPARSNLESLQGHLDPLYRGWDLNYSDLDRVERFISELHRFEQAGDMPRLQILRLPNDHTNGAWAGNLTPRAMVAQNDLAFGRLVEAVSRSRFWPQTAVFAVEDDAQNGPDHVDAHRTEALVISPYARSHAVDSNPYTTCSMLATIELILGLEPMSQFDADANPMAASFQATADLGAYTAVPNSISLSERNPSGTRAALESATFDLTREDAVDDLAFNRVIWESVRGPDAPVPAPVRAAFVRSLPDTDSDPD